MANGDNGLIAATTPPGGQAGLVAMFPASCGVVPGFRCIRITGTATGTGVTVRSPTRYGFGAGGAFSADGRWLAAFAVTNPGNGHAGPAAQLVIVASAYLVNTVTLAKRAVYFLPGDHRTLDINRDLNYSSVVLGYGG